MTVAESVNRRPKDQRGRARGARLGKDELVDENGHEGALGIELEVNVTLPEGWACGGRELELGRRRETRGVEEVGDDGTRLCDGEAVVRDNWGLRRS